MHDSFEFTNLLLLFVFWVLGLTIVYFVIKTAVRNGVREANVGLFESVRAIEDSVYELKKASE
ncbi:hypothetical protein [Desulfosporosinus sp. OT]|uniref:hypothetical protein n=1 Tax=Desulfosporosinus sp. OT TaxID=913865 RepID=UPI000223A910|nr:hypothetical protein [Desulfosporosinus sp. OT]EGW39074.1 hypothetical protein DOT_3025 [Desulfosporosinus sp. OT]